MNSLKDIHMNKRNNLLSLYKTRNISRRYITKIEQKDIDKNYNNQIKKNWNLSNIHVRIYDTIVSKQNINKRTNEAYSIS